MVSQNLTGSCIQIRIVLCRPFKEMKGTVQTAAGFPVLIRAFRLALSVEGLRPRTVQNYVRDIEQFAARLDGQRARSISAADLRAYFATLQDRCAPKTAHEAQIAMHRTLPQPPYRDVVERPGHNTRFT